MKTLWLHGQFVCMCEWVVFFGLVWVCFVLFGISRSCPFLLGLVLTVKCCLKYIGYCSCSMRNGGLYCPSTEPVANTSTSGLVTPSSEKSKCLWAVRVVRNRGDSSPYALKISTEEAALFTYSEIR